MSRATLTDARWERLRPLLPPQKPRTGRPAKDHRLILDGILWAARTGAPWRDLPPPFGPWQTVATRSPRSSKWPMPKDGSTGCPFRGWDDDPSAPARHRGRGGAPEAEALGRGRGGFSTEVNLRAEGNGTLLTLLLAPGQRHETSVFEQLMRRGAVRRQVANGRGCIPSLCQGCATVRRYDQQ